MELALQTTFLPSFEVLSRIPKNTETSSLVVREVIRHQKSSNENSLIWKRRQLLTQVEIEKNETASMFRGDGKFGKYGGKFVPETLVTCLGELEDEVNFALSDPQFQDELAIALKDYLGRETPLYFAERLTNHYKNANGQGPEIYLKREDLNHTGSHKINNAIAQAMLAERIGRKSIIAATGAGQHGIAAASACSKLNLECTILMGTIDLKKHSSSVLLMKTLGAKVKPVEGCIKDATSQAMREWIESLETSYLLSGSVVGPHPCPTMVKQFQSIIGTEIRKQAMEKWCGKPNVLVACVGSGSNALGMFDEFLGDKDVRLIGVEAGGFGLESGNHSATLARGEVGVYHGALTYLLQDIDGQIVGTHSIGVGLEYPGVGPELSFLKDTGRVEFYTATDQEAIEAFKLLCRLEAIIPALESSHALPYLEKLCPTLPNGAKVIVNCSGRGEKDITSLQHYVNSDLCEMICYSKESG